MKTKYLFPSYFSIVGIVLAVPGLILGCLFLFLNYNIPGFYAGEHLPKNMFASLSNYTNELALALTVAGLFLIAFSRTKKENEITSFLRLNALYWSILINYILYFIVLIFGIADWLLNLESFSSSISLFLTYNLFTPLLIFIIRFNYLIYKNRSMYYMPQLPLFKFYGTSIVWRLMAIILISSTVLFTFSNIDFLSFSKEWTFLQEYIYIIYYIIPFLILGAIYFKEHTEDKFINTIRLECMQMAFYANYTLLLIANFSFFYLDFLVVQILSLFTIPFIFILIFQYRLLLLSREQKSMTKQLT